MSITFLQVEKLFTDEIYKETTDQTNINFCCNEEDEREIITIKNHIKQVDQYSTLSDRDIFIVLIAIYYSLRLNEQSDDWLSGNFYKTKLSQKDLGESLYNNIVGGDIMLRGINLSSSIRRHITGIPITGGKKSKNKKTKNKRTKTKKTKNNRTKNKR